MIRVGDGLRINVRDWPGPSDHPPLLCLHGLTRNSRDFVTFAERFAAQRRVIALDFRGRGGSDWDPEPQRYVPLTYAHDVLALLDELAIDRAVFVGTSLGGLVAMTVAVLAPDRIAATVLNDVGPVLEPTAIARIQSYVGRDERFADWKAAAAAVQANQRGLPATYGDADWAAMARRLCREDEGRVRFDYDPAIATPFTAGQTAPAPDLWPLFDALATRPVLVVRGEQSDLLSAATLDAMARRNPNVRTVIVPGAGHAPELDEPEAVAAIEHFLGEIEP